jgi:excisionase family DNA binding protein
VLHKVATVARRLDASVRHVRRLIASGALPVHRIGRSVRVSEDDLLRFLAARRRAWSPRSACVTASHCSRSDRDYWPFDMEAICLR